ncbi:MAG: hypothetical protein UT11_C0019G0003 [Berkelbacteria bacterium GW2011_GWA2_38_9]|uniref:Uncharacterized protein n=1 Tax=Berkelbacteria bacterium GW2011_GWA2_38_9 TaxID=1618334 RepID=A0A0G0LCU6_9BACT|nr:MAG: hypothetical protein UT11_C0019G0003 [Berkelbacteria bacterium GW2011_GWA2_38_9]
MSKLFSVLVIVLSLVAGFGGGWVYQLTLGKASPTQTASPTNSTKSTTDPTKTTSTTTSSTTTLKDCLTEVWGADKYAAISANSSLATTEDNLASLKCYKD